MVLILKSNSNIFTTEGRASFILHGYTKDRPKHPRYASNDIVELRPLATGYIPVCDLILNPDDKITLFVILRKHFFKILK